jgi:hypothetical protein
MSVLFLLPALSMLAAGAGEGPVDFAAAAAMPDWMHDSITGDPSWDTFIHAAVNPVVRGKAPREWPVNGFLFRDPVSGNYYLYGGWYCEGYRRNREYPSTCIVYRSEDKSSTWTEIGPAIRKEGHVFNGEVSPLWFAPDVSVVYHDGAYHMAFDWATKNSTWQDAHNPPPDQNSGAGYARAEKPEGPFIPSENPICTTRDTEALLGKYRRQYASTLIRREKDWLVLTLTDSGPYFGWALIGRTAANPEGPWSDPELLLHPESARYLPPLLEYFPAFTHAGFIYAPATSVALNRNYQALFRVPAGEAMNAAAWEAVQMGSIWHAEPVENEHYGIWGQTFSGFIDSAATFHVMFPSRDRNGHGTLNIARRPWNRPLRDQGFVISGHAGPALALLRKAGKLRELSVRMKTKGTVTLLLQYRAPIGPDRPASNSTLHPLMHTRYTGLKVKGNTWTLLEKDAEGREKIFGNGQFAQSEVTHIQMTQENETVSIRINGDTCRESEDIACAGPWGLLLDTFSHAEVTAFRVDADFAPARICRLATDALAGAARHADAWGIREKDTRFRFGCGAITHGKGLLAKWNFRGRGFRLYAPRGPEFGSAALYLDGEKAGVINFHDEASRASEAVFENQTIPPGPHSLALHAGKDAVPVDVLEYTP